MGIVMTYSYSPTFMTRRSTMTMRKGNLKKNLDSFGGSNTSNSNNKVRPMAEGLAGETAATSGRKANWVPVAGIKSISELPQEENKVQLVETKADALMNAQVNPNGAVSVVKYNDNTYCFSSSCPSCKIPLTKAKVFPPNEETGNIHPRLACDFCSATFNIKTGEKISDAGGTGGLLVVLL